VKAYYDDWLGAESEFKGDRSQSQLPLLHHWRSLNLMAMGAGGGSRGYAPGLELDPMLLTPN